jgi:hypothetical protein
MVKTAEAIAAAAAIRTEIEHKPEKPPPTKTIIGIPASTVLPANPAGETGNSATVAVTTSPASVALPRTSTKPGAIAIAEANANNAPTTPRGRQRD